MQYRVFLAMQHGTDIGKCKSHDISAALRAPGYIITDEIFHTINNCFGFKTI